MQYEARGHFFDFIMARPRTIKIMKMAIIVEAGLIRLCDIGILCIIHNLSGMGYNKRVM